MDIRFTYKALKAVQARLNRQMRPLEWTIAAEFCARYERMDQANAHEIYEWYVACPTACLKYARQKGLDMAPWADYLEGRDNELFNEGINRLRS